MLVKVKGIILSETNYSESSKILNVLTDTYGLLGMMAKGARNIKSKLHVANKMIYGEFSINYKESGLSTISEINIINSFKNINFDLKKASYAFYIIDLVKDVLKENNNKEIFTLLEQALIKINEGLNPLFISNIVELQLLKYLGVSIELNHCIICGKKDNIKTIDINLGGLVCSNCYQDSFLLNEKTIKLLRLMYYVDLEKLDNINISDENLIKEIDDFIKEYYSRYTGIFLKNKDNIKKILVNLC